MKIVKIAHLTSVHHYNDTRIFYRYCKKLAFKGVDVMLFACTSHSFVEDGVRVYSLGVRGKLLRRLFITLPYALFSLLSYKPTIIHLHDPELLLLAPIFRLFGIRVVYDVHEDNFDNILQKKTILPILRLPVAAVVAFVEYLSSLYCHIIVAERYYKERFPESVLALNYPDSSYINSFEEDLRNLQLEGHSVIDLNEFSSEFNWFIYSGNVTIERGALTQLKILTESECAAIFYIGRCDKQTYALIQQWLFDSGICGSRFKLVGLEFHVPQSLITYYQLNVAWFAGLAIFPDSPFYRRKELTKFYEYYNARIPILCSDFLVWNKFVSDHSAGVVYQPGWMLDLAKVRAKLSDNPHIDFDWSQQLCDVMNLVYKIS